MSLKSANTMRVPASGVIALSTYALVAGSTLPKHGQFKDLAALQAVDASLCLYNMGAIGGNGGGWRHRGAHIGFAGTGADNSTYSVKIYGVWCSATGVRTLRLIGTVDVTLSATTGAADLMMESSSHRLADGIVFTASAWYTAALAAVGAAEPVAYSPGSDLEALLTIGDVLGASELLFDFDMTGATGAVLFVEGWT